MFEFLVAYLNPGFVLARIQRGANPQQGRFRDLVKTVLFHIIVNYQRQKQKLARQQPLPDDFDLPDPNQCAPPQAAERDFLKLWREELLDRVWIALEEYERGTGNTFYVALRRHAEQPGMSSEQLAKMLTTETGRALTAGGVRQTLHRAREKFAELLIDEVGRSLESVERDAVERELIDLDLLVYCKSALETRYPG